MDSHGPETWYIRLPRFTRAFITIVLGLTLLVLFKGVQPSTLSLNWPLVLQKLQVWRVFTNVLFVGKFSLRWVFFVMLFSQFSASLEKNAVFAGSPGSYLYFLVIQTVTLSSVSAAFFWPSGYPYLADALLFSIIYYWSKRDMFSVVTIYFVTVKGYQLPFAMMFLHLVMGSSLWVDLMGMISGHIYYLLREVLPSKGYKNYLARTPKVFDYIANQLDRLYARFLPASGATTGSFQYRPRATETRNHGFIGRGIRLGHS
nr:hypothetical protein MACL_00003692 [Theileria orientalis]